MKSYPVSGGEQSLVYILMAVRIMGMANITCILPILDDLPREAQIWSHHWRWHDICRLQDCTAGR